MELNEQNKKIIDSKTHFQLLDKWRFSSSGDRWLQGETGEYWGKRIAELKEKDPATAVKNSKTLGWGL